MEIAIIEHDGKKAEMIQFLMDFKALIIPKNITLISTGTTGKNAEKAGFKVKVARDGAQGVEIAQKFIPDLVKLGVNVKL